MTAQVITITTDDNGDVHVVIPQQRTLARHRPLMISQYLSERGVPVETIRRSATTFGKLLRVTYLTEYGREPEKTERWIGGKNRPVASYTTADKKLFDRVFRMMGL